MEAEVAITVFVQRVQSLALAVAEADLEWAPGLLMHGVRRLPVSVTLSGDSA
ncbi:hypothetical protein [Streptomyces sp. NPDC054804]